MRITLVYPGVSRIGFRSLGSPGHDSTRLNLGLGYIGAYLKQEGHKVDLIDLREMHDWQHTEEEIKNRESSVFGIQFNTVNFDNALRCARYAKKYERIVVAGGPHATIAPQEILDTGLVDYVITGEGEISFTRLINKLEKGENHLPQIIEGERIDNLDELPFPDRSLYHMEKILSSPYAFPFPGPGDVILATRGCTYNCAFCQPLDRLIFGNRVRYRSVGNVLKEIRYVRERYDINYIHFDDEILTFRKEWVKDFCYRIRQEEPGLKWSIQTRVDLFDEEIAGWLSNAGCICVTFGFESGSQRILNLLRKGITPQQALEVAGLCKRHCMIIFGNYMLGNPTETEGELKMTYKLLKQIRPEISSVSYFSPIPGSDLYKYCSSNNLLLVKKYQDFTRSPIGEKIVGVNYNLLPRYIKKINRFTPKWFQERFLAKLAIKRWVWLLKSGYVAIFVKEFIQYTFPHDFYNLTIRTYLFYLTLVSRTKYRLKRISEIFILSIPGIFLPFFGLF